MEKYKNSEEKEFKIRITIHECRNLEDDNKNRMNPYVKIFVIFLINCQVR